MSKRVTFAPDEEESDIIVAKNKKGETLGCLYYHKAWKTPVWEQNYAIIMSRDCLQEVVDKLKELEENA